MNEIKTQEKNPMRVPVPDFLWELCVGDQETGDVVCVEEADKGVDFRVHDWLTHKREGTVFDLQALLIPLQLYSRDTWRRIKEAYQLYRLLLTAVTVRKNLKSALALNQIS